MPYFCIAIDGPAGAGKSTIARRIAKKLGFIYVDTGAMYRAMALYFIRNHIKADDFDSIEKSCDKINISIEYKNGEQIVLLNGENVNTFIRTEEVGNMASAISVIKTVRLKLVELQRRLSQNNNIIMDGRDIGTYVLPDADLKIYLTASSHVRAQRRYKELKEKGIESDITVIENDIIERDRRDMTRDFAPLRRADDAIFLDTSDMTIDEVVEYIITLYNNKRMS